MPTKQTNEYEERNASTLPEGWTSRSIGSFAQTATGGTPSREVAAYYGGETPWVKSGELRDSVIVGTGETITAEGMAASNAKPFPIGTLLVALYGATAGKVGILGIEAATNQAVCAVFPDPTVSETHYLFYALINQRRQILRARYGGAQPNISQEVLRSVRILLPPLEEQRAIAHVLRTVQQAKEAIETVLAAARQLKASLMRHLFTYGPVPLGDINQVDLAEHHELGHLPRHWQVNSLGDIAEVMSGGTPSRAEPRFWGGDIPWVKTGEINYSVIEQTEEAITRGGLENSSARILPKGTLLMAMYGQGVTRGRVAVLGIDAAINQACAGFFPAPEITTHYLFWYFTFAYNRIRDLAHGGHQKNLSAMLLKSVKIPVPPLNEQHQIERILWTLQHKLRTEMRIAASVDVIFKGLLSDLMRGRRRVGTNEAES